MNLLNQNFIALYRVLMGYDFMKSATPAFGKKPTLTGVEKLVAAGAPFLPAIFRSAYVTPLSSHLDSVFARTDLAEPSTSSLLETLAGAVYQHNQKTLAPELHRFLAVISNLYRSFLDNAKRSYLKIPLQEKLPPLAVLQSMSSNGPFTLPVDSVHSLIGASVGVVSLPATFARHPFLFGSLTHETGGHDVIHADPELLPQLRKQVYGLFSGGKDPAFGLLWDYWMDEAASDVYGLLNMGPTFASNLAALLSVFIAQSERKNPKLPSIRTQSGTAEDGSLDPHPTDILRIALAQGVIATLKGLGAPTRNRYIVELDELAELCSSQATTIELAGTARVRSGGAYTFNNSYPIADLRQAARAVGEFIATTRFDALDGHSIQDVETWDDADENAAAGIATLLRAGKSIVQAGDDAQIIAGLTLGLLDQPQNYVAFSKLASDALDDSFRNDPFWGLPGMDKFVLKSTRPLPPSASPVDPYAAWIIDYNPLDHDDSILSGIAPGIVTQHAIDRIPWPASKVPTAYPIPSAPGPGDALPEADVVLVTWTAAEANAMSMALTPGFLAMPGSLAETHGSWYPYAHKFSEYRSRLRSGSPALAAGNLGKYFYSEIGGEKVLCFKSSLHLARDDDSLPVKDLFKQIATETKAKLIVTTGTAGAIGPRLILGDAVISTKSRFDCKRMLKNKPYNGQSYTSNYTLAADAQLDLANSKLIPANASRLPNLPRSPRIFAGDAVLGEPNTIVTTDIFAYDDSTDHYDLQGKGSMVEMDDAALGLACSELGDGAPDWLAIRNASDPQVGPGFTKAEAAKIYADYGYWTSLTSVIACWAVVTSRQGDEPPPAAVASRKRAARRAKP